MCDDKKDDIRFDDIVMIFKQLYTLPKYSDQIKDTLPDSEERSSKISELKQKLNELYSILFKEESVIHKEINSSNYHKHIYTLKTKLIQHIKAIFPNEPIYLIINKFHDILKDNEITLCEELMYDMVERGKEEIMRNDVQQILENIYKKHSNIENGKISLEELEKSVKEYGYGVPSIIAKEIMSHADTTKDGEICLKDFKDYTEKQVLKYYKIFYNLDSDNDFKLNFKQTKQSLHEIYPNLEFDDFFIQIYDMMDKDRSGLISFDEWCEFLIFYPQQNLKHLVDQWSLISLTNLDPQEPDSSFIEMDLMISAQTSSFIDTLKTFLCGGIAGGFSRTVTAPLERLKILYMTTYTESKPPGVWIGLKDIYRRYGLIGLFRGNSVSIMMNVLEQALRFSIIDYSKKKLQDENGQIKPREFLLIGVLTGILSTLILFPLDVVRIRLLSSEGEKHKVYNKFLKIYSIAGIRGFYSGFIPHLVSVLPAGSLNVVFYNVLRRLVITQNDIENSKLYKFMFVGGTAALITGTVTYPLSLLTSRIIVANRNVSNLKERIGTFTMIKTIFSHEGLAGFYKGYNASILRLIIGQSVNFGTYEIMKSSFSNSRNLK